MPVDRPGFVIGRGKPSGLASYWGHSPINASKPAVGVASVAASDAGA